MHAECNRSPAQVVQYTVLPSGAIPGKVLSMGKRVVWGIVFLFVLSGIAFAQGDRGTITGTVADAGNAVVGGASIEAKNLESGATYTAATTETGNYTLAQLPAGTVLSGSVLAMPALRVRLESLHFLYTYSDPLLTFPLRMKL